MSMHIPRDQLQVNTALKVLIAALFIMIALGGATRLTGSGLSITQWDLIWGIFPPLRAVDWTELFHKYQQSPEFVQRNSWMNLGDFQQIFWLEYVHRLWGRILGIFVLYVHARAHLSTLWKQYYRPRVFILWALLLTQGYMGWYMVQSGLDTRGFVSPYRLVMHLSLAGIMMALALAMIRIDSYDRYPLSRKLPMAATLCAGLTILLGALVAGHKAGLIYTTFPLMDGNFLPDELTAHTPWWEIFYAVPASVQFFHRLMATLTVLLGVSLSRSLWNQREFKRSIITLTLLACQYILGILTLLMHVPVGLGVLHQLTAFALFAWLIWVTRCAKLSLRSMTALT